MEISERIRIDRPRAEVFAAWSSLERWPEYADGVVEWTKLTPGAVGKGTRFRAADRWPGRTVRYGVEVTAFEPPERIAATWTDPMSGGCDAIFEDVEGGTEMRYDASLDPSGVVGFLLPLLRPWVRRRAKAQLRGFRAWVESGDSVAARRFGAGA